LRALVVDDLESARRILGARLVEAGFQVDPACDGVEALRRLHEEPPDVIVSDFQMPRLDGMQLLSRVREVSDVPFVMITIFGSIPDCEAAMRQGADRFLQFAQDSERIGVIARALVDAFRARTIPASGRRLRSLPETLPEALERSCEAIEGTTAEDARARARSDLRRELQRLVVECHGNIAEMARRMGRDRSTVRYHLRRLGLLEASHSGPPMSR